MKTVEDGVKAVLEHVPAPGLERVSLLESAGRVLQESIGVPDDLPAFSKSLMDGYAVALDDLTESGVGRSPSDLLRLRVVGVVVAGQVPGRPLNSREAMQVMTGAPVPQNCYCVVPVERVRVDGDHSEWVEVPVSQLIRGAHVLAAGAIARKGDLVLRAGTYLRPARLGAIAELGIAEVVVSRRPAVAILSTGNELVPVDGTPGPGMIRNSSQLMLAAQVQTAGAIPELLGIARDDSEQLSLKIAEGLRADVFVLTGGVSVGILDLVPQQLSQAGVVRVFHGVWMKPGKPMWFGIYRTSSHTCLVFGLPGNPVSSLACFELFVRPALGRLQGLADPVPYVAILSERCQVRGERPVYQPVVLIQETGTLRATPVSWSNSADLLATVAANGFARLEPEHGVYEAGEPVEVWPWNSRPWCFDGS